MSKKEFTQFAQLQSMDGYRVEFQPKHLLCEECWSLAFTSYIEARFFGKGISSVTLQKEGDDPCGMTASVEKEAA